MNDDGLRGADPVAFAVQLGIEANGADDGGGRHIYRVHMFEERLERDANRLAATCEQSGGVGVAVNRGVIREAELFGDVDRMAPVKEIVFDGVAVGMSANGAFARMALQVGTAGCFFALGELHGLGSVLNIVLIDFLNNVVNFRTLSHVPSSAGLKSAPTHAKANGDFLSIVETTYTQICGGLTS